MDNSRNYDYRQIGMCFMAGIGIGCGYFRDPQNLLATQQFSEEQQQILTLIAAQTTELDRDSLRLLPQPTDMNPDYYAKLLKALDAATLTQEQTRMLREGHANRAQLYTYRAQTDALAAVTHVNGTARIQTVSFESNRSLYELLVAFKARSGYGVLCNTSLNFKGRGFINKIKDLSAYAIEHNLDGFVVEGRAYLLKGSDRYRTYLQRPNSSSGPFSS